MGVVGVVGVILNHSSPRHCARFLAVLCLYFTFLRAAGVIFVKFKSDPLKSGIQTVDDIPLTSR